MFGIWLGGVTVAGQYFGLPNIRHLCPAPVRTIEGLNFRDFLSVPSRRHCFVVL